MAVETMRMDVERTRSACMSEYRFYFILAYPICLVATALRRLSRQGQGAKRRESIFREAAGSARSGLPWLFMG